jgi:ankyrin repeat protein
LYLASENGHKKVVRLLLDEGANINTMAGEEGEYGTALRAASINEHKTVARLLLDERADIDAYGQWCGTVLQAALENGKKTVMRLLLNKGADINALGRGNRAALQVPSAGGHVAVVRLLLDKGVDIDAQTELLMHRGGDVIALQCWQRHPEVTWEFSDCSWIKYVWIKPEGSHRSCVDFGD